MWMLRFQMVYNNILQRLGLLQEKIIGWGGGGVGADLKVANYPLMRMREVQTKLRALSAGPI